MKNLPLILGIITIGLALFTISTNTNNVWNTPNFDIKVENLEKNEIGKKPVDEIVRVIYDERNYMKLTAEWIRDKDTEFIRELKERERFSSEDLWVLDRIFYNPESDGLSQKITIKNDGYFQAHDVIIQITGKDNLKIIEYTCPEIMSDDQIIKKFGKNYIISMPRMSVKLNCEIIINGVESKGLKEVIVTAEQSNPRIWPNDSINDIRTYSIILNIALFLAIGAIAIIVIYNIAKMYEKRINQNNQSAIKNN